MGLAFRITTAVVLAAATVSGCDQRSESPGPGQQPADEAAFIAAKVAAASAYDQAPNDIVRSQIEDQWREKDSCSALKTASFSAWTGTVKSILSDGGFIVDLGDSVSVESDVDPSTPVFKVISGLREGDAVKLSGEFVSDDAKCAAQVIAPPWGDSAIKSPDFKVHFLDVSPL